MAITPAAVKQKITQARLRLLFKQPFFGTLTMHLKLVDATDSGWCPTAAVDGRSIFYNSNFFADLDIEEIMFVLCHEVLHVALDHFGRRSHRDPSWWNMANDYVINGMLVSDKIGKMPTKSVPDKDSKGNVSQRVGLYNDKYLGWTSEAVYDDLEKRKEKKQMTLDVHLELGDDDKGQKGSGQGQPGDKDGQGNGIPIKMTAEELKALKGEMKNTILQAAQAAAGNMPASLKRLISDLVEPKINWRDLLQQNIQSCITDDFTWMRPNKRHMYSGISLPTLDKDETINIQVAIDMSGSISDSMAMDFLSEVHGIMNSYNDFTIGIVCFDTQVYNYQEFTKDTADELLSYECKGGGGTDFLAFWNFWMEQQSEPKKAVIFTDGYPCGDWGPADYCDTLWVITDGARNHIVPPFGQYAYYDHGNGVEEVGQA
jgi:predicted metal-dependent peptidase